MSNFIQPLFFEPVMRIFLIKPFLGCVQLSENLRQRDPRAGKKGGGNLSIDFLNILGKGKPGQYCFFPILKYHGLHFRFEKVVLIKVLDIIVF